MVFTYGLPQWLSGKESSCNVGNAGDAGLIPRSGRSPGGGDIATHSSILVRKIPWTEEPVGYSPWGCASQTQLKRLSTHQKPAEVFASNHAHTHPLFTIESPFFNPKADSLGSLGGLRKCSGKPEEEVNQPGKECPIW